MLFQINGAWLFLHVGVDFGSEVLEMPKGLVKTKSDESLWRRAKKLADNKYPVATTIYKRMKAAKRKLKKKG